ncbi:MAG: dihydrofolate reductase [Bacilli bacterium]|nr:dihydrofolate reductase [Bacilli bacterium]
MKLSIIACVGKNLELGVNNDLIFHIKEDMKYFKDVTLNHIVVMGRKTFESLPGILKDRKNVVITRSKNISFPDEVEVYQSIEEFMEHYKDYPDEIFVIGGASIYRQFLDYCDKIYLTEVDASRDADVYFPEFDKSLYNKEIVKSGESKTLKYNFVIYRRK